MLIKNSCRIAVVTLLLYACSGHDERAVLKKCQCLLDSIGQGDTLHVNYIASGCENYDEEEIKMYKTTQGFSAELRVEALQDVQPSPALIHPLADTALQAYAAFESWGKTLRTDKGCTIQKSYTISLNAGKIMFEDKSCRYSNYLALKEKIFGSAALEKLDKSFRQAQ